MKLPQSTVAPLHVQLRQNPSADPTSRRLALTAVDSMLSDAHRYAQLLAEARAEISRTPNGNMATGRAAMLARAAYVARTNAEVTKFKAAYAILAEDEGTKAAGLKRAAQLVTSAKEHAPLIERVKYHEKRRDLMLQAANATTKALKRIPPLPTHVTKEAAVLPSTHELLASPTMGYRPKVFSKLTGNFFPDDVRAAAGGLADLGDVPPPDNAPAWWDSLQKAIGYGVQSASVAAADEGQKAATQNPTGGAALNLGSGVLRMLSTMINGQSATPASQPITGGPDWGAIALVGGSVVVGGYLIVKLLHKGK